MMVRFTLITTAFLLIFSCPVMAESVRQNLLDLTTSIRQAEQRTQQINHILSDLRDQADDLRGDITKFEYETARQLDHIASLNKNNTALTYLSPHENFLDHHYTHRTKQSIKTILSTRLQAHQTTLSQLQKTEDDIQKYMNDRAEMEQAVTQLRQQINYKHEANNIDIKNKINDLKEQNNNLDEFLKTLLNLNDIAVVDTERPLNFSLPLSGILKETDDMISITAAPQTLVTSPEKAVVAYADNYKNLGNIVILNHGQGYVSVLRGMSQIYVQAGFQIGKGEPLGILNGDGREKGGKDAMLYFQLRYNNQIINPIEKLTGL